MRATIFSSLMAVALFAVPAMAQSSSQQQRQQGSQAQQQGGQMRAMTQDKLRSTLEQAGFKNVTVLDAAYLVQAQSPHGEQVMMLINPPAAGSAMSGSGGAGSATAGGSDGAGGQPKAQSGKQ